ncbi:MAG: carboxymuconolactone decarboxylase family protein [Opitutaceae bacterium]|jgi:alkylhydroperoxidase/carboxymuconolactone decarboxylase family protein YurZ/quercetin dioxygenase-like cupin family protein|nr:carboxymuconolactone decarboxylase family protein [Opitutaceae bacterium]
MTTLSLAAAANSNTVAVATADNTAGGSTPPPKKQTAGRDRLGAFAPKFAGLNDDVLFGQIWSRERELSPRDRSMITVAALISGGNFEQLSSHLKKAKENGVTQPEIAEVITHLAFYAGWPKAWSAFRIAKEIYGDAPDANNTAATGETNPNTAVSAAAPAAAAIKNAHLKNGALFPPGAKITNANFTGDAWLQMLHVAPVQLNAAIGSVTFAPAARNNWHTHETGQILLVTGGEGFYQEWGKPACFLKTGDTVNIPPNIKHWHGAAKDSWFAHLAITPGATQWLEPVTDAHYDCEQNRHEEMKPPGKTEHYTFQLSGKVTRQKVTFKNRYGILLTGDLYIPENRGESPLAALVISGPFGAVKEQSSGLYANTMAARGFVTLAFDPVLYGRKRRRTPPCRIPRHKHRGFQRGG